MKIKKKAAAVTSAVMALSIVSYYPTITTETSLPSGIVYAEEAKTADGLLYVEEGTDAVITGYEGTATDITVPEKIGDLTVTRIGDGAFKNTAITSIALPSGITEIGPEAFYKCEGLKKITIPSEVRTIRYDAFKNCVNLTEVELNDGLSAIGNHAFSGTSLIEISIPESVTSIDASFNGLKTLKKAVFKGERSEIPGRAFYYCLGLETIEFPDSLMEIGPEAFYKCEGLTQLTFPENLRTIRYDAFGSCVNLTAVELNDGLSAIGNHAFSGTSLKEISIPESVTSIDASFQGLKTLKKAVFNGERAEIPGRAFYYCLGLETIEFPDSLMEIGPEAFYKCEGLTQLTFPENLITIRYDAFGSCVNLTAVELNNDLAEIGNHAFSGTSLKEISIPESVTSIDASFQGLKTLKKVVFKGKRSDIPVRAFYYCSGLETIEFPDSLTEIKHESFYKCDGLKKLTFPESLKTIDYDAFGSCANLTEVKLNDGLETIGSHAFSGTAIKEISIPESLSVCNAAFANTDTLKKVEFRGKRTVIPGTAFQYCKYITEITAPADTEHIYMSAFEGCKYLKTLKILNPNCVMDGKVKISDYLTIYGYENSTAQKYAEENNYKFALLEDAPVIAESPAPSPSPTPATSPDPSPVPTTVTSPDPSPVPTPVSSPDPSPVPTSTPTAEPKVEVIPVEDADMNDDSVITMADYVTLIKRILTANVEYDAAFDINKDNKIDAADVITLRKVFLGTVVCE